jgi:hypothetical protein
MLRIKILASFILFAVVGVVGLIPGQSVSLAKPDSVIEQIGQYKQWKRVTDTPIVVGVNAEIAG